MRALSVSPDGMPPCGAHLVASRVGYTHHGIYAGEGKVVHYAGLFSSKHGLIEEVDLMDFAAGRSITVLACADARFTRREVVARAQSRLGERRYNLIANNCEHFCAWCITGEGHSAQVERWLSAPRAVAEAVLRVIRSFTSQMGESTGSLHSDPGQGCRVATN
jgi:hypothetical protein